MKNADNPDGSIYRPTGIITKSENLQSNNNFPRKNTFFRIQTRKTDNYANYFSPRHYKEIQGKFAPIFRQKSQKNSLPGTPEADWNGYPCA
ncbi:MAG: hypothetical protein K2J62_03490, partial [Bacteroidales bacterium]|nr:hypothetical protein [Bacteroidales bacterium]